MNARSAAPRRRWAATLALALAVAGSGAALAAQGPVRYRDPVFGRVQRTNDLVYGQATDIPTGQTVDLKLDLYQPQGDTEAARPVLVFIHGGGFTGGDKSAGQRWAEEFARRGWVAASIGYRLRQGNVGSVGIPAAVSDARQAVRWLRGQAAAQRLDVGRVVVGGSSAGAITALYLAYTQLETGPDDAASAVAGVMDLWGALYGREGDMAAGEPPLVIVHGTEDTVVPYRYAEALRDRAQAVGLPFDFHPLEGVGHGSGETAQISAWTAEFLYPLLWPAAPTPTLGPTPAATDTATPPPASSPTATLAPATPTLAAPTGVPLPPAIYLPLALADARPDAPPAGATGVTPEELARYRAAAEYSASAQGDALVIAKGGRLVFEDYVGNVTADTPHMLASGTKSFGVALFALAAADGLWTLDERVADTIVEWRDDPRKARITLRHLLALSSGLEDAPEYTAGNTAGQDTYDLAINGSVARAEPGEACIYTAANFQALAALFERKTGGTDPARFLYDRLLGELGFRAAHMALWARDNQGHPQMAGGARFTAREWLNYGLLWRNGGAWNGRQLLDPELVRLAVTYDNPAFRGYGLTWWLNLDTTGTYDPAADQIPADARGDGSRLAANAPGDMYVAAGLAKQRLYVIPSADLVAVRFGHTLQDDAWSDHTLLGKMLGVP